MTKQPIVKPLTKKQIAAKIKEVLASGKWILRRNGEDGKSYKGFQWNPIGVWTEAPDFNRNKECGGGLHGNGPKSSGYWTDGKRLDFCAVENAVDIDGDKIKCRRAMILMHGIPKGLKKFGGWLDLSGCDLKGITLPSSVGGYLDLSWCDLKGITLPSSVGGYLDLSGCDLKGITLPSSVGGSLYLSGCDVKGITLPSSVGGYLYLSGCDLKGITLPSSVGGSLYLRGCKNIPDHLPTKNVWR